MKIAFFCIEFPPINTTGNYRNAGIVRHLLHNNEEVIVFTCTVDSGVKTFEKKADYSLMEGLENAKIFRYEIKPFKKIWQSKLGNSIRIWWNTTDKIDLRWFQGKTKNQILEIIKIEKPDFLYFSLPPFSFSRLAVKMHNITGIPIIVDMRDAWSLWGLSPHQSIIHYWKKKLMERTLFNKAYIILGVTAELIEDFKAQHPGIDPKKFNLIFNGADSFKSEINNHVNNEDFKIGYVGSFYFSPESENWKKRKWYEKGPLKLLRYSPRKEQWLYRSPYYFLQSLAKLIEVKPELIKKIKFEYVGMAPPWLFKMIEGFNLSEIFVNHGFKDKMEVLKIQSNWNAILATSEKIEKGNHYCLPSKIFDVVESRKRILAFVTNGAQKTFLKEYPQSTFFDPDDTVQNALKLEKIICYDEYFEAKNLSIFYSRSHQSQLLSKLLYEFNTKD